MANLEFAALRDEYANLWRTMTVRSGKTVDMVAEKIIGHKARYQNVEKLTGVPWFMVGAIHAMECGLMFTGHLHNGDPLTARTKQVPANRPAAGKPPFSWEESALDALKMAPHSLHLIKEWPIERIAFELERYNGWGYRKYHPETKSPYLWSFTNHYEKGKYVADGKWSASAVSSQVGAMAIVKRLSFLDASVAAHIKAPLAVPPPPDVHPVEPKPSVGAWATFFAALLTAFNRKG
jgi:lysozyme family protein